MAAPNHPDGRLHALTSRSIRRDPSLLHSPSMQNMRAAFGHIAAQRHVARSQSATLADRLSLHAAGAGDGTPAEREEELRRMLGSALSSLGALGDIYEARELRWREEMRRLSDDRESVELLLRQTLGVGMPGGPSTFVMPPSPLG